MSDVFRREGDFWTVEHRDKVFRLKHTKGLHYIAHLLANPGREIHAVDLVATVEGAAPGARRGPQARQLIDEGLSPGGLGDAGEILDPSARRAYKNRLKDLQEELDEAEQFNDPARASRAREEMEALTDQLSGAVGLGGRSRRAGSAAERARVNVRNSIASALKSIRRHDADLAQHLSKAIRTGTFCSYVGGETLERSAPSRPDAETTASPARGSLRLMLVDDHPMWRETLRQVLEERGIGAVVAQASDGPEAVEMLDVAAPDVVVMDIELPTMTGIEATRRLVTARPDLKVLVLSSSDDRRDVVDAVRAGATGYLVKTAEPGAVTDGVLRVHRGELVFPPTVAGAVLDELRRLGRTSESPEKSGRRRRRS